MKLATLAFLVPLISLGGYVFPMTLRRQLVLCALVAVTCGLVSAQDNTAATDWVRIETCQISLLLPRDLKRTDMQGLDSCIAQFDNNKMLLSIDYGRYGGAARKHETSLEFKEERISIDGKTAQLATYIDDSLDARKNPNRKYVAHLYVEVKLLEKERAWMEMSLMIDVHGDSEEVQEVAKRIFRSVRFR